jgi:hypothetical protein
MWSGTIYWEWDKLCGVGQFIGSGTNYVEWDNLLGVGQFIWDRDNLVGEGLIFESGTI